MFHLEISKNRVNLKEREVLVSGASKSHLVQFAFSSDWEGLNRTAVFRAGEVSRSEVLSHTNQCHIPWEVLEMTGRILWAGVEGTDGEGLVLPTVWCALGCISPGAHPGDDEAQPPTPDVYSQLLAVANKAAETAKSVRDDADAGKFDGADGKDGVDGKDGAPGADGADAPQIEDEAVTATNPWSSKNIVDRLCPAFSVSGNPVTCQPVEGYPLGVQVSWEPTQEGEGDPSPDNVRPIRGWTDANLIVAGKNLFDVQNGIILKAYITGSSVVGSDAVRSVAIRCIPGAVYTVSREPITSAFSVGFTDSAPQAGSAIFSHHRESPDASYTTITAPQNAKYLVAYIYNRNITPEINVDDVLNSIQIEYGGTATSYEPYRGQTITLPFGQTVYGGTLDAVTGVGSEDFGFISLNGTEDWIPQGSQMRSAFQVQSPAPDYTGICSHFAYLGNFSGNCLFVYTNRYIYIGSALFAQYNNDVEQWKSYLVSQAAAGTPVQVCYKLATPQPIQATGGQTIPALSGTNTIYTDGDSVTVSGRADSLATIQAMQEQIAALTQHIAEGGTV